jgi:hypothetical protein
MTVVAKKQNPKTFSFYNFPLVFFCYVVKQVFLHKMSKSDFLIFSFLFEKIL